MLENTGIHCIYLLVECFQDYQMSDQNIAKILF